MRFYTFILLAITCLGFQLAPKAPLLPSVEASQPLGRGFFTTSDTSATDSSRQAHGTDTVVEDTLTASFVADTLAKDSSLAEASALGIIGGEATGPARGLANLFQVALYGPDDKSKFISSKPFGWSGSYTFDELPEGTYWVIMRSTTNTPVKVSPRKKRIRIRKGSTYTLDFSFK